MYIHNLTKKYNSKTVLKNVSLSFEKGKITGVIGPNGAGKSTLISIATGLLKPTSGYVSLQKDNPQQITKNDISMLGYMSQDIVLFDELSTIENLQSMCMLHKISQTEAKKRIHTILHDLALETHTHTIAKHLSGGYKRRLHLACSIIHNPQYIFLDEPSPGIDPQSRRYLWEYITTLKKQEKTIILTDHYLDEAEKLCDYVYIVDNGTIIDHGTVGDLIKKHIPQALINVTIENNTEQFDDAPFAFTKTQTGFSVSSPHDPSHVISEILSYLNKKQITMNNLDLTKGSLEDVFLLLTGKKIR